MASLIKNVRYNGNPNEKCALTFAGATLPVEETVIYLG